MAKDRFECEIDFSQLSSYGPLAWMVRPCEWYLQEYRDCKSIRARVHQYFITGSYSSCDDWRDDYYSCSKFRKSNDLNALNRVIDSELRRKEKRLANCRANDVWQYRTEPPQDWSKPIIDKQQCNS